MSPPVSQDDGGDDVRRRSRRQGGRLLAVLRELRGGHDPLRSRADLRAAGAAGLKFDANLLEDAFKAGAKALVLCHPSNPCGKVFTREELTVIADLAKKYDTYVITDEVYEHIVYAPNRHTYLASLPDMAERTISCSSLSKTYSITGWWLGYVIASPEVIEVVRKVHDFLTVGAAAPLQAWPPT